MPRSEDIAEISEALRRAVACHRAGQLGEAERLYRGVLRRDPQQPQALHLLGVIAFQANHPKAAEGLIRRAIGYGAGAAEVYNNLGNALKAQGRYEEAVAAYRQAIERAPDHASAHGNLGVAYFEQGRIELAIRSHRAALCLDPDNPTALSNLGAALQVDGQHQEAIEAFSRAFEIHPGYADAHNNAALSLEALGRRDEAVAAYRQAIALNPQKAETHVNLGSLLLDQKRREEALEAFRRGLALEPENPRFLLATANALNGGARYEEALEVLHRADRLEPGQLPVLLALGHAHWATGEADQARRRLEEALTVDRDSADALVGLAAICYRDRSPGDAAALLERAVAADPGHRRARFYLAMALDQLGDTPAAEAHIETLESSGADALLDSWRYAKDRSGPNTRWFASSQDTLAHCLDLASVDGLVLEFGVLFGRSLNFIAARCERRIHGFDSFEGLPEPWGDNPAGAYSSGGRLPEVPDHVTLHAGWFEDTLPRFLADHRAPVRFMNVDCDLYSSTRTVLEHLGERIVPGSVILFDEYLCTGRWREDEYKAFQEAVARFGWRYEYRAFNLYAKQAAVIIT